MNTIHKIGFLTFCSILLLSCENKQESTATSIPEYQIVDQELYEKIVALDKQYFDAYNTCDMETQANMYAEDIEFFHDKGGLMTSKPDLLQSLKDNICDKVTRELVPGSIEVYPINNYGAIEIGYHKFYNSEEPDAISTPSKFIAVWKNTNENWQMTKVISLH